MAHIAPQNFEYRGLAAPGAYLRLDQHAIQVFKEQRSGHLIAALFKSAAAFAAKAQPINPNRRYITVNLVADKPATTRQMDDNSPDGTITLTVWSPDIVRWWGETPVDPFFTDKQWNMNGLGNIYAQANLILGAILESLPGHAGFVSDVPK
jgi:hypothetical protein